MAPALNDPVTAYLPVRPDQLFTICERTLWHLSHIPKGAYSCTQRRLWTGGRSGERLVTRFLRGRTVGPQSSSATHLDDMGYKSDVNRCRRVFPPIVPIAEYQAVQKDAGGILHDTLRGEPA